MRPILHGRRRIFTDEKYIDESNIVKVLRKAYTEHLVNQEEIQYLLDYELGDQPLPREKTKRPDIDIKISENAANYVTDFWEGYFWGIPPVLIQHGDREMHRTDPASDDTGIAALNEMLLNGLKVSCENQILGRFLEISGIGHRLIDIKTDFEDDPHVYVNMYTLDSRYTFCVYYNGVGQKKMMGVTYVITQSGKVRFTCYTDDARYEVSGWKVTNTEIEKQINPFGVVPIVEYNRAIDRTGRWERHISYMDGLNSLVSDFANDVAQNVQQIWWGDNVDFEIDEKTGEPIKPKSGEWFLTYSAENRKATVQPLASNLDRASTLNAIAFEWNRILQKCKVPVQQESVGGGSTGMATSMASGWNTAEVDAMRQEAIVSKSFKEELRLILKALEFVPPRILPMDAEIRKVHPSDIDFHFNRNKNYDLSIKANTLATLINSGMNGRDAIKLSEIAPDAEAVWLNSQKIIEMKQNKMFSETSTSTNSDAGTNADGSSKGVRTGLQDVSMQGYNSPFINGLSTGQS